MIVGVTSSITAVHHSRAITEGVVICRAIWQTTWVIVDLVEFRIGIRQTKGVGCRTNFGVVYNISTREIWINLEADRDIYSGSGSHRAYLICSQVARYIPFTVGE